MARYESSYLPRCSDLARFELPDMLAQWHGWPEPSKRLAKRFVLDRGRKTLVTFRDLPDEGP